MRQRLNAEEYTKGILDGNRFMLSRAITLVESKNPADQLLAHQVFENILPHTGNSVRIGITGVPGVGKSTFIESFGKMLTTKGLKVAVLAIDPSSQKTGGSIMGDKTRMESLANDPLAYVRPSPAGEALGGVARMTSECVLLCEATGFEVIIVETVGVGQSEIEVRNMTDFFLLLMLAGAGDELQGIKKGIIENADLLAINKADGDNLMKARQARAMYQKALHWLPPNESGLSVEAVICSAQENMGLEKIFKIIQDFKTKTQANGRFELRRQAQNKYRMHRTIQAELKKRFYEHPIIKNELKIKEKQAQNGELHAVNVARELLNLYEKSIKLKSENS